METLALFLSFTKLLKMPYLTTEDRSVKSWGLLVTNCSMNGKASIAVLSTTSMRTRPRTHFWISYPAISLSRWLRVLAAMAPPIEWPTRIIERSGYLSWTKVRTSIASSIRLAWDILASSSWSSLYTCSPWPIQSKLMTVFSAFNVSAITENVIAVFPAPCMHKKMWPCDPAK